MEKELLKKIKNNQILEEDFFELALEISNLINSEEIDNQTYGRELIIRVLDNWSFVPRKYRTLFTDLISAAGFYPYIQKMNLSINDFSDEIRMAFHKSNYLESKYFHSEQKRIEELLKKDVNVVVSAPTSFGKSMLIEEIVASEKYKNIVIIQPTLALLDETRRKLKIFSEKYKIIVKTNQEISKNKGNIFLLTAERVLEYIDMPPIQLLILDEFYKLSNKRDDNRNNVLNIAFIRLMKNPQCRFYMLGPNIDSISKGFIEKYNAVFYKTNYSMVITESYNQYNSVKHNKGGKVAQDELFSILDTIEGQTLIFCASPSTARKLAFSFSKHLESKGNRNIKELSLIEWINENISYNWSFSRCLKHGIAVHDGAMPKHITSSIIQYFNQKKIKYLFCTNTIIEGVNTSAKNVIYYDNKIGKRDIDFFDYSNIKGRAGRLMEHYIGNIINLHEPPQIEKTHVNLPFIEQNPIDTEVLVNLDEQEIINIDNNISRYNDFKSKDIDLQKILIQNGVTIEGQENILEILMNDLKNPQCRDKIIWNNIDKNLYMRISYIFDICWENLSTTEERKSFGQKGWIIHKVVGSCYGTSTNKMIEGDVEYTAVQLAKKKGVKFQSVNKIFELYPEIMQENIDKVIEKIFALQKNWLQYRAPKWISVVDSLQRYATKQLGLESGDYGYIAELIENGFIQSKLSILLEFGMPHSAVQKIENYFLDLNIDINKITEEEIIEYLLGQKKEMSRILSVYEMEIFDRAI